MVEENEEGIPSFQEISPTFPTERAFEGIDTIDIEDVLNKEIVVEEFALRPSSFREGDFAVVKIKINGDEKVITTGSKVLMDQLKMAKNKEKIPFKATIKRIELDEGRKYYTFK